MGYTTRFDGQFTFDADPTVSVVRDINALQSMDSPEGAPSSYCQWVVSEDLRGIKWDGGEKFYEYADWLQWIIDNILKPANLSIRGSVHWRGEDATDSGHIVVEGDQHVRLEATPPISDELWELKLFRDFALNRYDDLLGEWCEHKSHLGSAIRDELNRG